MADAPARPPDRDWPGPDATERLLAGGPADPDAPGEQRLGALLRRLTAGVRGHVPDPAREEAAVAAFRAALRGAVRPADE